MSASELVNGPSGGTDTDPPPVPSPPKAATTKQPRAKKRPAALQPQAKIKRKRTPTDTYQSHIVAAAQQCRGVGLPIEKKEVYYSKGDFLAVRNEEGSYYMCQASQNVYKSSKNLKVRWLEMVKSPDIYGFAYYDTVEMDSVLTDVTMEMRQRERIHLSKKEGQRIELLLTKAKQKEEGKLDEQEEAHILAMELSDVASEEDEGDEDEEEDVKEENDDDDDVVDDDEEAEEEEKKKVRNSRLKVKSKAVKGRRGRPPKVKPIHKPTLVQKGKRKRGRPVGSGKNKAVQKGKKKKRGRPGRKPQKKEDKRNKKGKLKFSKERDINRKLTANLDIEVVTKDPTFEVRGESEMPEVSPLMMCKKAIRAVLTNDMKNLQDLIAANKKVSTVFVYRSVDVEQDAMHYAITHNNQQAIKLLGTSLKDPQPDRVELPECLLQAQSTGRYNFRSLGHATRALSQSRGCREGNNAFIKEKMLSTDAYSVRNYVRFALEKGVSKAILNVLIATVPNFKMYLFDNVFIAVRNGHHKLAGHIIEMAEKSGGYGFNFLHKEVLLYDNEELSKFRTASVRKKPFENDVILPLHCAAINPNSKYLSKLLAVLPDYNVGDKIGRRPIHYAAVCEGTGPLELLLARGCNPEETDNMGHTPLMLAAKTARVHNIEVLMKKMKDKQSQDDDEDVGRGPLGGVDRVNRSSYTALHFAAENGHTDAVRALIKHGSNVEKPLSSGRNKVTPLILAAAHGSLATVKLLVEAGAAIEKKDKLKRTALMHAVMNGQYPVASYLMRKGSSVNAADSSGNTVTHYAAGYGWWYCLKLLIKGGACINAPNDWKTTPLGIAILKGHTGCADLLLDQEGVDINFKDEIGCTLVMLVSGSPLVKSLTTQIKYLVKSKKADVTLTDVNNNNALHHLANNSIHENQYSTKVDSGKVDISLEVARILLDHGCNPSTVNSEGETPLVVAIQQNNVELVKLLVDRGSQIHSEDNDMNKVGENLLHIMAKQCLESDLSALIDTIVSKDSGDGDSNQMNALHKMSKQVDSEGFTPLLRWAQVYADYNPSRIYKTDVEKKNMYVHGRNMLKAFVEKVKADVNVQVAKRQKKHDTDEEYNERGLQTVAHILTNTREFEVTENDETTDRPALAMFLKFKVDLNQRDKDGDTPLLMAIRKQHKSAAEILVSAGADVSLSSQDEKNDGKASPLVLAAREGLHSLVGSIAKKTTDINAADSRNQKTALHYACIYTAASTHDASEAVTSLLACGASVNATDDKQSTPLHYAVNSNSGGPDSSVEIEEILLDNDASPMATDKYGRLPLHYAFVKMGQHRDRSQVDPIEVVTLLTKAMNNQGVNTKDMYGQTSLHRAALRGATICVLHFISHEKEMKIILDEKDNDGNTPLGLAVQGGHDSCAILLIQKNANTNVNIYYPVNKTKPDKDKKDEDLESTWKYCPYKLPDPKAYEATLFNKVVENKWQGVIFLLMEQLELHQMEYAAAVNSAMEAYTFQLVSSLLRKQKDDAKIQVTVKKNRNLLHTLALTVTQTEDENIQQQCHKIAESLLKRGLKLTVKDQYGCTPVHYLALMQDKKLCKALLDKAASQVKESLQIADNRGRVPMIALFWDSMFDGQTEAVVKYFLDNGATLDCRGPFPQIEYKDFRENDIAGYDAEEWFLSSSPGKALSTPLINAIVRQNFSAIKYLLQNGASVNYCDDNKMTPLMYAAKTNNIDIVKLLCNFDHEAKITKQKADSFNISAAHRIGMRGVPFSGPNVGVDDDNDDDDDEDDDDENEDDDEDMDEDADNDVEEMECDDDKEDDEAKNKKKEPKFEKKSDVDICAIDNEGRSVVHHLMKTCEYGTFENVELLELLDELGAPLEQTDKKGRSPLQCAVESRSVVMATTLQRLLKVDKKDWVKINFEKETWTDNLTWNSDKPNFESDAKTMMKQIIGDKEPVDNNVENKVPETKINGDVTIDMANKDSVKDDSGSDKVTDGLDKDKVKAETDKEVAMDTTEKEKVRDVKEKGDAKDAKEEKMEIDNIADKASVVDSSEKEKITDNKEKDKIIDNGEKESSENTEKDKTNDSGEKNKVNDNAEKDKVVDKKDKEIISDKVTDNAEKTKVTDSSEKDKVTDNDKVAEKDTIDDVTEVDSAKKDGKVLKSDGTDKKKEADSKVQEEKREVMKTIMKKKKDFLFAEVDPYSELTEGGEVFINEDQNIAYDVLLTKVDVSYGKWGMNNFYKMQVIYQKGKDMYVLFTRWGRIGDEGQYQRTPFQNSADAVKEFCKVFKAKTGNLWSNIKDFTKQPKKYGLIRAEQRKLRKEELTEIDFKLDSDVPSILPKPIKEIFDQLTDVCMLKAAFAQTQIDSHFMPFGRLPRDVLQQAKEVLNKIRVFVDESEKQQKDGLPDIQKYQEAMEKVADLSSEYFQLIPSAGYVYENMEPLNEADDLKKEVNKLNNLLDLEVASQVLLGAQLKKKEIHPCDYVYRAIGCQMKLLDKDSAVAQSILKYIQNTSTGIEVQGIFALRREGEEDRLNSCEIDNHMLLWHGTSAANLISILMRGLLVAPPEAPVTGYMFGKGIYTADTFNKSVNYCYTYGASTQSRFMLLTEVALGKVKELTEATFMDSSYKGYNSTKGLGVYGPDPKHNLRTPSGSLIPQGTQINNTHPVKGSNFELNWNEYIVYDQDQVCLRYLVVFR